MTQNISEAERKRAREISFSGGEHRGNQVRFQELVFELGDSGWVEGTTSEGKKLRLTLAEIDRFDIEISERPGDDKTHHFYWVLIAAGPRQLIYSTREPEYAYNPIPGLTRKDCVDLNLGALGTLVPLPCLRSQFMALEPWQAFRKEGEVGPAKTPEQRKAEEPSTAQVYGCFTGLTGFMLYALWLFWKNVIAR